MIKSKIKVINVEYEKEKAELMSAQIKIRYGESQKVLSNCKCIPKKLD